MNIDPNTALARAYATSDAHRTVVEIAHSGDRGNQIKYRQVSLSTDQVLERSQRADGFAGSLSSGDSAEVTFDFSNRPETGATTSPFTETQKGVIRETLNNFSDAANIRFKESANAQSHHMQFKVDGSFKWQAPWYAPVSDDEPGRVQVTLTQSHADGLEKPIILAVTSLQRLRPLKWGFLTRRPQHRKISMRKIRWLTRSGVLFWKPAQTIALINRMAKTINIQVHR